MTLFAYGTIPEEPAEPAAEAVAEPNVGNTIMSTETNEEN